MGLDMYLYANKYMSGSMWDGAPEYYKEQSRQYAEIIELIGAQTYGKLVDMPSVQIQLKVAQWRKANAIHGWFVENVQDGEDECKKTYVGREQLEQLLDLCKQVLDDTSKAEELLPVTAGFFFGSYEYDEWYYDYVRDTMNMIEAVLTNVPDECDFYYQSSW